MAEAIGSWDWCKMDACQLRGELAKLALNDPLVRRAFDVMRRTTLSEEMLIRLVLIQNAELTELRERLIRHMRGCPTRVENGARI